MPFGALCGHWLATGTTGFSVHVRTPCREAYRLSSRAASICRQAARDRGQQGYRSIFDRRRGFRRWLR